MTDFEKKKWDMLLHGWGRCVTGCEYCRIYLFKAKENQMMSDAVVYL